MSKVWLLTKILLKGNMGENQKISNKVKIPLYIILFFSMLPIAIMFYLLAHTLITAMNDLHQADFALAILLNMSVVIVFIFSFFSIPPLYYFANDIEYIMPLPFKPWEIVLSKFNTAIIYEYIVVIYFLIPISIAFFQVMGFEFISALSMIFAFLLLPIVPVVYASIIIMLLMRFSRFFNNKERFTLIVGLLSIGFAIWIQIFSGQMQNQDPANLISAITSEGGLINMLVLIFPNVIWLSKATVNSNIIYLLMYIGYNVAMVAIFLYVAKLVYFPGVLNISGSNSKKRKLTQAEMFKTTKSNKIMTSYMKQEVRELYRSSTYLINHVLISILLPLILILSVMANSGLAEITNYLGRFDFFTNTSLNIAMVAGLSVGIFSGGMNNIATTLVSRTGKNFFFMKIIPVDYETQIRAKLLPGIILGAFGTIFTVIAVVILIKLPITIGLIACFFGLLGSILSNTVNLAIGNSKPKLDWLTETQVSKNSFAAFVGVMASMGLGALVFLFLLLRKQPYLLVGALMIAVIVGVTWIAYKTAIKIFIEFADNFE